MLSPLLQLLEQQEATSTPQQPGETLAARARAAEPYVLTEAILQRLG